jgi:hypothetical protein
LAAKENQMMFIKTEVNQTGDAPLLGGHDEQGDGPERTFGPIDTTTYLLRSEANRQRLLAAIENVNTGRNMVELPMDMLW